MAKKIPVDHHPGIDGFIPEAIIAAQNIEAKMGHKYYSRAFFAAMNKVTAQHRLRQLTQDDKNDIKFFYGE